MFSDDGDSFKTKISLSRSSMFICENQDSQRDREPNVVDFETNDMRRFNIN